MRIFQALFLSICGMTNPLDAQTLEDLLQAPGSHAVLDLQIPLPVVLPLLEELIPLTFTDRVSDPAGSAVKDDQLTINARRGPIELSAQNGRLRVATTATGRGRFTGEVLFTDISETLDVRADGLAFGGATLQEDWSLRLDLTARATLSEAEIRVFGIKISLRSLFQEKLNEAIARELAEITANAAMPGYLHDAASDLWSNACAETSIDGVTLQTIPTQIAIRQPIFAEDALLLTVVLSSEVISAASELQCPALPAALVILE